MLPLVQRPRVLRTLSKSKWIYTIQWIVIIILIGIHTVSCNKVCTTKDLLSLQGPCRAENDALVAKVGTNHTQQLCSALAKFWLCVAKNVPQCFTNMTKIYESLTHSPHYCKMSNEDFRRIQDFINASEKNGETTLAISQSREPGSTTKAAKGEEDGYVVDGATSQQNGNSGSSLWDSNHVMYVLLILLVKLS